MNLKIIYRSTTVWNLILFVLLSYVFLYVQDCIFLGKSAVELAQLKSFVLSSKDLLAAVAVVIMLVYRVKKISKWTFILLVIAITANISQSLLQDFNKLVLTMLFLFLIFSYYFFLTLVSELNKSSLNPNFDSDELFEPMLHRLKVSILKGDSSFVGYLTNWDENSCFVVLDSDFSEKLSGGHIEIELDYEGHRFRQSGKISTVIYNKGVGINFLSSSSEEVSGWSEYFDLISDLGYTMEHLK